MKRLTYFLWTFLATLALSVPSVLAGNYRLSNDKIAIEIDENGSLVGLTNVKTGHNYAKGGYLWRMYFDTKQEKEIQIFGGEQKPQITQQKDCILLKYPKLTTRGKDYQFELNLTLRLEADKVRFESSMSNHEEHTVIREFHYPLVHDINTPKDHKLYTSEAGGKLYPSPFKTINKLAASPYKKPEQFFRQKDVKYGARVFMNCFALLGAKQGLYFGSHDETFQDTWHGLRVYKGADGQFDVLEMGFFKYPHCFNGETWSCKANVVAPYSGTWHNASKIYRAWVNTWWDQRKTPLWVKEMNSWQRVIFKHQYGEYFFKYPDLYGHLKDVDKSINSNAVFLFGWWKEGMDNGYPNYSPDDTQGGDEALKQSIAKYQADGSNLILYFNGKLIDRESKFYKSGMGPKVCRHDNTGSEILERYKFTGHGTWLGEYDQRTFAVATMMDPDWNKVLCQYQDRAFQMGARSVFFDQLGYIESESANWDNSREFPVPDVFGIKKRGECLKMLRERYNKQAPDFALGAEGTVDALAQYCDFTHGFPANETADRFIQFFKFTFPDIVFTDRGQRDDTNVQWHVNNILLDGQRVDIEIYRCRDLIDDCPIYQAYLGQANKLRTKYKEELLLGKYRDTLGFKNSNKQADARAYFSEDGKKVAIIVANQNKVASTVTTHIDVPGYKLSESSSLGKAQVSGQDVTLGQYDLALLLFKK